MSSPLQFVPFVPDIELGFYLSLFGLKLNTDKLDDSARRVLGLYEPSLEEPESSCRVLLLGNSLTSTGTNAPSPPLGKMRAEGTIKNVNTLEAFGNLDKRAMLEDAGRQIWDAINDGSIYSVPSLLSSFIVLSYADLKKYKFTYLAAFPALRSDTLWERSGPVERLNSMESTALVDMVGTWRYSVDSRQHGFFLVKKIHGEEKDTDRPESSQGLPFRWEVASLREFENGFFDQVADEDCYFAFADPSTYPENPGSPLRNFLVLIRQRFRLTKIKIICYRDIHARRQEARSVVLPLEMGSVENLKMTEMPNVVGWVRNSNGKIQPLQIDVARYLDPDVQTNDAFDMNTKLMKWRIAPELDLDTIKNTKCLLLGAGTLGCHVAPLLMGWGVKKVTFVDHGRVSPSNVVRQPLYKAVHAADGGKLKAPTAAAVLKEMFPGMDSAGHELLIPMVGCPYIDESKAIEEYEKLEELIDEHDAIFLLLDSRESRWLPTVMGKAKGKIVMNAALGFDSYVVMRHGSESHAKGQTPLGCYFCNDIVAPGDSQKDQTLDQQCSVTRPGAAPLAAGDLVELLVNILQHPLGKDAQAPQPTPGVVPERDPPDHPLGLVPHQIRGYISTFQKLVIRGQSYDCCSACSPKILDAYRSDGWGFVKRALQEKDYVSELSGLAEVQRSAEAMSSQVDWEE
ncbi:ubiquitin-like modifier-activating enzyme atg-7 [Fusarium pseudoanthophilum]|uniref:Ubiquitin-like modifier-activating enzyme ATG7 n=1 Tax=Fusarium pseudoanthophilum TaxID=48495 RepID=A0A8H5PI32_9HYPO|nr:ubiquitin-like modifier-activating enzyme atg-7 [Fusarium pseudoanthophilum]